MLKQGNELLKISTSYKEKLFEILDEKMASLQEYIISKRKDFLTNLEVYLKEFNEEFVINLKYNSFVENASKDEILKKYKV